MYMFGVVRTLTYPNFIIHSVEQDEASKSLRSHWKTHRRRPSPRFHTLLSPTHIPHKHIQSRNQALKYEKSSMFSYLWVWILCILRSRSKALGKQSRRNQPPNHPPGTKRRKVQQYIYMYIFGTISCANSTNLFFASVCICLFQSILVLEQWRDQDVTDGDNFKDEEN